MFFKIKLAKNLRAALLVVSGLLFAASLYGIYFMYHKPVLIEKSVPVYSYEQKGNLTYNVQLKPNDIYGTAVGPGQTYFTKLVNSIDTNCSYRFTADKNAFMKVAYSIIATVDAPKMWKKDFILVPETVLNAQGKTISFNRDFQVDLAYFNAYLKAINEQLGSSAREPKLVIRADISLEAVTEEGTVREALIPTMIVPLSSGDFKIGGELSPLENGSFTKTRQIADPTIQRKRMISIITASVLGLLFMFFSFLTRSKQKEDNQQQKIDWIWRMYGDHMVKVQEDVLMFDDFLVIPLGSPEELVKVADELSKPVIYQAPDDPERLPALFVIDGLTAYKYSISYNDSSHHNLIISGRNKGFPSIQ